MSIVVTGGAGFIGSCIVRMLNDKGINDIIIVDNIGESEKWRNLVNKKYKEYVHKSQFLDRLTTYENITHIIHMGACSSTTEKNFDYLYNNNYEYTKRLWNYCVDKQISFIYASSAATYGDGSHGFSDEMDITKLTPLNGYGYSKQLFDLWVLEQREYPSQHVGLKFFNVYGPNEYCKNTMASVVYHGFKQVKETNTIKLFKSYNPEYEDGGQLRDFVYVKDICKVINFFLDHKDKSGLFNVGTGTAESFLTLGKAVFKALGMEPNIQYIKMPEHLQEKYQYFTQATMNKLKAIGYNERFYTLEEGTINYVQNYLNNNYQIY